MATKCDRENHKLGQKLQARTAKGDEFLKILSLKWQRQAGDGSNMLSITASFLGENQLIYWSVY